MANQTELLNVSDEMKLDDERQSFEGLECGEGLCSSSSDTTEELYSSSAPDACGDGLLAVEETLILCGVEGFLKKIYLCFWQEKMYIKSKILRWTIKLVYGSNIAYENSASEFS